MTHGWTEERRERQAEAIHRWKPWNRSTGPKSEEGKATASRNAWKGGQWTEHRALIRRMNHILRSLNQVLK